MIYSTIDVHANCLENLERVRRTFWIWAAGKQNTFIITNSQQRCTEPLLNFVNSALLTDGLVSFGASTSACAKVHWSTILYLYLPLTSHSGMGLKSLSSHSGVGRKSFKITSKSMVKLLFSSDKIWQIAPREKIFNNDLWPICDRAKWHTRPLNESRPTC